MPNKKILVIEDDPTVAEAVVEKLRSSGFRTIERHTGRDGLAAFRDEEPDLVILDLMLPGMDGLDVFRALRKHSSVPVIMLTAKASESDRVAGIEMGADDYIVKPFYMRELVARVKMVLRRAKAGVEPVEEIIRVRGISIDRARRTVTAGDREVTLTPQEFALLECLARNHGRALTREVILQQAWGESEYIDPRTVDVHIRWLREKLEDDPSAPRHILTVRGVGYKMAE